MRIVVCSAQVPFERGGAEMLAEALVDALVLRGHRADLVALPFKWYPTTALFKSALAWRMLDLTESNGGRIDRIITTKFPSYAARHPQKIVWLVHQFRQVYDWFGTPLSDWNGSPEGREARRRIVALDNRALGEARARYAISRNVAARLEQFNGLTAEPLYPPPRLAGKFRAGEYGDYILYLGRLDRAKRVDLLIQALSLVPRGRAIIAGRGAELDRLKALARACGVAERVEFAGFVEDEQAIELYANARAVFYAPIDEDYGFATVEAMLSARPVLTTRDAGGVLEFVEHEVTGLVSEAQPEQVAAALGRALADPARCREWGRAGQARVRGISWDAVIERLVS